MRFPRVWRLLPGLGALGAMLTAWSLTGVPVGQGLLYLAAFAWTVVVPGVLVHRALRGRPKQLIADLALGAGVGLVLQLAAWALLTLTHLQRWTLAWPAVVVVVFLLVPQLRESFACPRYPRVLHPAAGWLALAAFALALTAYAWRVMATSALPPGPMNWYQDNFWHLAAAAELMRSLPPEVPQVAGVPFNYHWFADAHMASMASATGIDLPSVAVRLWAPPVLGVGVALCLAAAIRLTGRAWPGAVAAWLVAVSPAIPFSSWFSLPGSGVLVMDSPSQLYAFPVLVMLIDALGACVLGQGDWRTRLPDWGILAAVALTATGAKSSLLPVTLAGLLAAGIAALVVRARRIVIVICGAVAALAVLATKPLVAGGSAGVGMQWFSSVRATNAWIVFADLKPVTVSTAPLLPGLDRPGGVQLLVILLVAYFVQFAWLAVGFPALGRNPMSWLLLGMGVGGWWAMMLVNHDGMSQIYFMSGAVIGWALLAAWGFSRSWERAVAMMGVRVSASAALIGAPLGICLAAAAQWVGGTGADPATYVTAISGSVLVFAVVAMLGAGALVALAMLERARAAAALSVAMATALISAASMPTAMRFVPALVSPPTAVQASALGLAVAALLAAVVLLPARHWWSKSGDILTGMSAFALVVVIGFGLVLGTPPRVVPAPPVKETISVDEVGAARFLASRAGLDDIVATNVHCLAKRTVNNCDARAFWVSALTQRRVLVEGWAYTEAAHLAHGVNGLRYAQQPFPDQALFALNQAAFGAPTPDVLAALRARGVRWLYADPAASAVSPALAKLARPVYRQGEVTVYSLD